MLLLLSSLVILPVPLVKDHLQLIVSLAPTPRELLSITLVPATLPLFSMNRMEPVEIPPMPQLNATLVFIEILFQPNALFPQAALLQKDSLIQVQGIVFKTAQLADMLKVPVKSV